jgi:hypothetical protein
MYSRRLGIALALSALLIFSTLTIGCGPQNVHDFKSDLNKAAQTLNTAAKTNRTLYQQKVFGDRALDIRRKVATGIHAANESLIVALDIAKDMDAATFTGDKQQILALLGEAVTKLAATHIGDNRIDVILQTAAALINSVIVIVSAMTHADLRIPQRLIRSEINKQLAGFAVVREYSFADMGD